MPKSEKFVTVTLISTVRFIIVSVPVPWQNRGWEGNPCRADYQWVTEFLILDRSMTGGVDGVEYRCFISKKERQLLLNILLFWHLLLVLVIPNNVEHFHKKRRKTCCSGVSSSVIFKWISLLFHCLLSLCRYWKQVIVLDLFTFSM